MLIKRGVNVSGRSRDYCMNLTKGKIILYYGEELLFSKVIDQQFAYIRYDNLISNNQMRVKFESAGSNDYTFATFFGSLNGGK